MKPIEKLVKQLDPTFLAEQLDATDAFATANVQAGRGGPFGAALHVVNLDTRERIQIGGLAANAVLATGIASQHAEAEMLSPENQQALRDTLAGLKKQGQTNLAVVMTSSGQSCPACHAKQEIMARKLAKEGLLEKGKFIVTYGATFEDTAKIAGFNDAPYVWDNLRRLDNQTKGLMVKVKHVHISEIPKRIRRKFLIAQADGERIAYLEGANVTVKAKDHRNKDVHATAGVSVIRKACKTQNNDKLPAPWMLGNREDAPKKKATLYITVKHPGPLVLAEAQWAGVAKIVCIDGLGQDNKTMRETPDVPNTRFAEACWAGYNRPESYLTVLRIMSFANRAQHAWRDKLAQEGNAILYNGLAADPKLARYEKEMHTRFSGIVVPRP